MRAVTQVLTASAGGAGPAVVLNLDNNPFAVSVVTLVSGAMVYTLQHTYDDVTEIGVTPVWFNHPTMVAKSVGATANYAFPVTATRVYFSSGAGELRVTFLQAGGPVWEDLDDAQSVSWVAIPDTQTPNWAPINDAQTPSWV
jgi:hypothetical protein